MDFHEPKILGQTGLKVGRLGVSASYGAPTRAFEEAFERGCNYFYWGLHSRLDRRNGLYIRVASATPAMRTCISRGDGDVNQIMECTFSRSCSL